MSYLLDANVFMSAKNLHYGFDFCPAFWEWLVIKNADKKVFSIEKVGDELFAVEDELSEWAKARDQNFFLKPDANILPSLREISRWVSSQQYRENAINAFLQQADYYLIAQARAGLHAVVTHEVPSDSINKVKIPDVCIGLEIKCVTPYEMLRTERARFVLKKDGRKPEE